MVRYLMIGVLLVSANANANLEEDWQLILFESSYVDTNNEKFPSKDACEKAKVISTEPGFCDDANKTFIGAASLGLKLKAYPTLFGRTEDCASQYTIAIEIMTDRAAYKPYPETMQKYGSTSLNVYLVDLAYELTAYGTLGMLSVEYLPFSDYTKKVNGIRHFANAVYTACRKNKRPTVWNVEQG